MDAHRHMRPPAVIPFKRGDVVMLGCTAYDDAGAPANLNQYQVAAEVRTPAGTLVAAMAVEWVDRAAGTFELWAPGDGRATSWPLGNLEIDVQYTATTGGARPMVRSSETFYLQIQKDVTA
jgi:hypothetical protein